MNAAKRCAVCWLATLALVTLPALCRGAGREFFVSPSGADSATGTAAAPFRTLERAQQAVRTAAATMDGDIVVNLAPGDYRLEKTWELTEADSGRPGFRVIWRSAGGPGKARLLGSRVLTGWQPAGGGLWKVDLPAGLVFHTLYENGRRVFKARYPNLERDPEMPCALGKYLVTVDGTPKRTDKSTVKHEGPGWLQYRPADAPPSTAVSTMKLAIFTGGPCAWHRDIFDVTNIDPQSCRLTFAAKALPFGIGPNARFFLEDEKALLDAPGEFYLDAAAHTLFYMPLGPGHPDTLGIAAPLVGRLVQIRGAARDACVQNMCLDGLGLEETDDAPPVIWWSTQFGRRDGALIWMSNASHVEIRNCHLRNGGRSGIMLIGHNTDNRIRGCWIEQLGVNGITLCNRFYAADGKSLTADRCQGNRVENCRINDVGQIHTYAGCINAFDVSDNEVTHCELFNSVRYAVTLRGNTGEQYGPPVSNNLPPTKGNRFSYLRVWRCGHDGGDMGALHTASLNNPGGGCVNMFEQVTVADTQAIPSMKDIAPDGIFLDWPKMGMDQIFRNVHIIRSAGLQLRSHGPDNGESAQTTNVSWQPGFREESMDYDQIGLTDEFPREFGGRPPRPAPLAAPRQFRASAPTYNSVRLEWEALPSRPGNPPPVYSITRDGQPLAQTSQPHYVDRPLAETTAFRYAVTARVGDFMRPSPAAAAEVRTPADKVPPVATGARLLPDHRHIRVAFDEPVDEQSALAAANYRLTPAATITAVRRVTPDCVELALEGAASKIPNELTVANVCDAAAAHNRMPQSISLKLNAAQAVAVYSLERPGTEWLYDASGGGGHARLLGGAAVQSAAGPAGRPALVLDGKTAYAEAPADLNLGAGDWTLMAWIYRENGGVIASKGNGFGSPRQWSWGWVQAGVPHSVALRVNNVYFSTAAGSVPMREWVHVAFVKRGSTGVSYVNGKPSGGPHDLSQVGPLENDRPLRIGRREHEPAPTWFKGKIAELQMLPVALDEAQIRTHAQQR